MKQCTKCGDTKKYSDFHKNKKSPDGYKTWCILCVREYDQNRIDTFRKYPRKKMGNKINCRRCLEYFEPKEGRGRKKSYCDPCYDFIGHTHNIKRFGITVQQYIEMENLQNGKCKICNLKGNKRLSVDHDHSCCSGAKSCGKCIRGLVCFRCNTTLGMVKDDKDLLQKMIEYINLY